MLVIAGSKSMYGACYLSALATLRMGVGLVDIYTHEVNRAAIQTMLPEAILHVYGDDGFDKEILNELIKQADCVLMGPGISVDDIAMETVRFVLENCEKSLIVDADALNCIAKNKDLLYNQNRFANREIIITPHPGELSRLTGESIAQLKENYIHIIEAFAKQYRLIVVGKDAGTVVSDGCNVYLNQTGNEGMATAGSGDVLSGIIAGLCAQGEAGFDAAWKGVYLHGRAGDYALEQSNSYSLIAGDIANALTQII